MSTDALTPEVRVLAIASHVAYGYVGNKMACFVMQVLGCDVSVINTVHFSNHTAYKQFRGRKVPAEEITELYEGLKDSNLADFDMLLSGYAASKDAVEAVGAIVRDLKLRATIRPGSFFWILDPVMGDEGRLYVNEEIVSTYRCLLHEADLIVPNSFEAELLSDIKIRDMETLVTAIAKLHKTYQVPHILVTSLKISPETAKEDSKGQMLAVVGSSCRKDFSPRVFYITVPAFPVFFSGSGDLFAALTLFRFREAVINFSEDPDLIRTKSWQVSDDVPATSLPLAKATEKTLASMHIVLKKTAQLMNEQMAVHRAVNESSEEGAKALHLKQTKASEVRVVRYVDDLLHPRVDSEDSGLFQAQAFNIEVHDTV